MGATKCVSRGKTVNLVLGLAKMLPKFQTSDQGRVCHIFVHASR